MAEELRAPAAGRILAVLVDPGVRVEAEDELLILEAMKMENLVFAPFDGVVTTVLVAPGEEVARDQPMLVMSRS